MYNFRLDNISGNLDTDQQIKKYHEALGRKIAVGQAFIIKGKRKQATKEFYKILVRYNDETSLSTIKSLYQLNYPQFEKDLLPLLEDYCNFLEKNSSPKERLAQCFSNLSSAYQDDKQHDKAIGMALKSLELLSITSGTAVLQIAVAKQQIGRCYLKAKRFREALPHLEEADEFWSASAIHFMLIAMTMHNTNLFLPFANLYSCSAKEDVYEAYIGQGMKEKAIQALAAISLPAKLPEINETLIAQYYRNCQGSFFKLANTYLDDKNYSEAINTLNPLLNNVKDIPRAYSLRSFAFEGNKDFESAKEDLLKVIDLDGKTAIRCVMLGDLYLNLRQYDDAEKAYKDALKIEPNNPSALHNLGVCFGRQGQKVIAADYYYRAGSIYLKNNERDSALLALDNLKKIDSEFYDKLFFAIYKEKPSKERTKEKERN